MHLFHVMIPGTLYVNIILSLTNTGSLVKLVHVVVCYAGFVCVCVCVFASYVF